MADTLPTIKDIKEMDEDGAVRLMQAVVVQAADDYRKASGFLKKRPHVRRLDKIIKKQRYAREKRARQRKRDGLPPIKEKPTAEERLLDKIIKNESMVAEVETFLKSKYCHLFTENGELILKGLREEAADGR